MTPPLRTVKEQLEKVTAQTKGLPVSPPPFDWRRFEGETVKVWWPRLKTTVFKGVEDLLDDFTRDTGIKVENYCPPEGDIGGERDFSDLTKLPDGVALDAYPQSLDYSGFYLAAHGNILPLTGFLNDPTMTAPDYDFHDFMRPVRVAAGFGGADVLYSVPLLFENYFLLYNKRLLDEYFGGQVPRTMPDLISQCHAVTGNSRQSAQGKIEDVIFGIISRTVGPVGQIDTLTSVVYNALAMHSPPKYPWNIWFNEDFTKPNLDDPRILGGIRSLGDLLDAGPTAEEIDYLYERPGAEEYFNPQLRLFLEERAVFFLAPTQFGVYCHGPDEGPEGVNEIGPGKLDFANTGYSLLPPMEAAQPAASGLWTMGWVIPTLSENPPLGWFFIQYMTNRKSAARIGWYHVGPPRKSTWADPEYLQYVSPALVDVVYRSAGSSFLTTVASVYGATVAYIIEDMARRIWADGANIEQAARDATSELRNLYRGPQS